MDLYYEETSLVKNPEKPLKRYKTFRILFIASFVLGVIWLLYTFNGGVHFTDETIIEAMIVTFVPITLFFWIGAIFWKIANKQYIDYDYCFSSGTMMVSKIYKSSKRINVIQFSALNIYKIGKVDSDTYKNEINSPGVSIIKATFNEEPSDGKAFYYIAFTRDAKKIVLILDCTETMIANVYKFSSKLVLERDFKWSI
ncbi:MAG: hypothetical protein E7342_05580 [Clostridiales bacterium]|nr:hypothetical protein [Clostridiales bacterium]